MGRGCTMDEWVHFQKLLEEGRVPGSSYWFVLCRHCVSGFEQKQLFNAPTKITGRRSAMRAHLKICPVYATQYKMEQSAVVAPVVPTTTTLTTTGEKRKRKTSEESGGRGKHCMMEEWEHFTRLQDEGYIGKSNFFYAVCKHCQRAQEEAAEDQKELLEPEKLVGRREKLRKHLALCPHFKGELPPIERKIHQRGNGMPPSIVLSALAGTTRLGVTTATDSTESSGAIIATNGSSRLALNEWHYFTRLERKKDSAYYYARCNFCQQAYETAPESMKTSMEPTIVMGRKSNMQTHLAKCLHVPKDAAAIAEYSANIAGMAITAPLNENIPSEAKRIKLDEVNGSSMLSTDNSALDNAMVRLLIEYHLPFKWVESDSAKQLFHALIPVQEVADNLLPSELEYRTNVLDAVHSATLLSELMKLQELIPLELGAPAFSVDTLSVAPMESWPIMLHCSLSSSEQLEDVQVPTIDGVVTNGKAVVSLSFLRAQKPEAGVDAALAHYHGLELARWLDDHLRLCVDPGKLTLGIVVLPYNTITQRAVSILRAPAYCPRVVFLPDMEDLLKYPLLKLLASAEMFTVVSSLIEVWQLESIRLCVMERLSQMDSGVHTNPFRDWKSCATLIQVLLDEKTFEESTTRGAPNAKKLVENALNRSLLERMYNLLHVFMNAFSNCRTGLTLSETLVQLGALFTAADGFLTVQLALELIWEQMEQPLFVLAHGLNPRLRLRDLNSTEITKLSTLSDLSVTYFTSLFGRKPSMLRGEVTAYLHASQRVFTRDFVAEFPVLDDYFRYLSDNFPSLSMLMQVLMSFSSASLANHQTRKKSCSDIYTSEEHQKLDYLRARWGIKHDTGDEEDEETASRIAAHNDRSGAAMLNAGVVVDEWKETLEFALRLRGVEFSLLEDKFDSVDEAEVETTSCDETMTHELKLPSLELDDDLTFPSVPLRAEFSIKVPLKDLFKTAEATI